jgi:6-phosphofructokinase 1
VERKNVLVRTKRGITSGETTYNRFTRDQEVVLVDVARYEQENHEAKCFVRAGPRERVVWAPGEVKACIVTCGGLCPGLNDVIHELFQVLYYNYGVDVIYGIRNGYRGFWHEKYRPWERLTPSMIAHISQQGGTFLGSSRGGYDLEKIASAIEEHGVNQVYIVGGDGTHRAAELIMQELHRRKLKVCVVGVPKTIDNDVGVIDRSFGFNTAIKHASTAILSAMVEAQCTPNGVGIVTLMGRHAGFIATNATLAAKNVDMCLIPEVDYSLTEILEHVLAVVSRQGHCVMVVAEGAGENLLQDAPSITDESGNVKKVGSIGLYLKGQISAYCASRLPAEEPVSIKYHDPSYMIRSTPAEAEDRVYCLQLAQNAVHGAMAGYTGFTSSQVNHRSVYVPISVITAASPSRLNPKGRTWERVLSITHQREPKKKQLASKL